MKNDNSNIALKLTEISLSWSTKIIKIKTKIKIN